MVRLSSGNMRIFLFALLIPGVVFAQVNLCLDDKGRKTYTEAECNEIGMKPIGVIKDIKPKSKNCYDLENSMNSQYEQAAKLKETRNDFNTGQAMAIIIEGSAKRTETQYKKECKR